METEVHRVLSTEEKIDAILASTQKTEKYFKATLIITVVMFLLPLLALIVIVPMVLSGYTSEMQGLL